MKLGRDKETAFTLIEMLVVIAIIAVLAAMLLVPLSGAKARARSTACKSNLRQMGVALQLYVHDYQGFYPHYLGPDGQSYGDGKEDGLVYWSSKLFPYRSLNWTNRSFHCPSYAGEISAQFDEGGIDRHGSYAYNTGGVRQEVPGNHPNAPLREFLGLGPVMFWKDAQGNPIPAVSESRISVPSEMLAICDALMRPDSVGGDDIGQCTNSFGGNPPTPLYVSGHTDKYNLLFCDGHIAAMNPLILFSPTNSAALWNYDHHPHSELWIP